MGGHGLKWLLAAGLVLTPSIASAGFQMWLNARFGAQFFTHSRFPELERLSEVMSGTPDSRRIEFEDKIWEIPLGVRLAFQGNDRFQAYLVYERQPFVLQQEPPTIEDLLNQTRDTDRLEAGANLWGVGLDFQALEGFGQSLRLGVSGGYLDMKGRDKDLAGIRNYEVEGTGYFVDVYLMADHEFTDEIHLLPFVAFRFAKATDTQTIDTRSPEALDVPPYEIDYSSVTLGISARFRLYPFGSEPQTSSP